MMSGFIEYIPANCEIGILNRVYSYTYICISMFLTL